MSHVTESAAAGPLQDNGEAPLRWPPPGLETIHGAAWPVITLLAVGGVLMTMPMLWSLSSQPPFWSPGPFGGAWWLPSAASLLGLFMVMTALVRATLLLRAASRAAECGYDAGTIAYVACDATRDAGFLMQGMRQYASLGEHERQWLLRTRVVAALAYATSLLWIPVSFTFGIVLASRGVLDGVESLWPVMLVPAGALLMGALAARTFDGMVTRRSRAAWRKSGARATHTTLEATAWLRERATRFGEQHARRSSARVPRFSAVGVSALAVLLPLPIVLLALLSVIGPILARETTPRFGVMSGRIARMEILQPYSLPVDSAIDATDAGETLHVLLYVGRPGAQRAPVERAPVRTYAEPWLASDRPESLRTFEQIVQRVLERNEPLTTAEQDYLKRATAHPAHAEFARLARAPRVDVAGGRWNSSTFGTTNIWDLPLPRLFPLREAANVHLARGILEAQRGDHDAAQTTFREVISVGLLLMRNSPTAIEMLIGSSMAQSGAHALHTYYAWNGRTADANAIRVALESIDAAEAAAKSLYPMLDVEASMRGLMAIASNPGVPPGLRWESLTALQLSARCVNANAALFGRGENYDRWVEQTHATLVRFPSEEGLFRLMEDRLGTVPEEVRRRANLVESLIGLTFGRRESAAACAGLATAVALY